MQQLQQSPYSFFAMFWTRSAGLSENLQAALALCRQNQNSESPLHNNQSSDPKKGKYLFMHKQKMNKMTYKYYYLLTLPCLDWFYILNFSGWYFYY